MTQRQHVTRRRFLGFSAATAGGAMLSTAVGLSAAPIAFPSTDHFWYRLQPAGPYIDSQRANKAFGREEKTLALSEDNGRTWPHRLAFPDAPRITFSHILNNGNVLFATGTKLYLSTDNLKTYQRITVKDAKGADYLPHTPQNPDNPGWYFHTLSGVLSWDIGGKEMLVWGNYCNVLGGAAPVNIYYSTDNGQSVKIAYAFGQNPNFRDDGSPGGSTTGALLGNPDNPVIARHIHCVAYNPVGRRLLCLHRRRRSARGERVPLAAWHLRRPEGPVALEGHRHRQLEHPLQMRRHQFRRREGLLDKRRERPQTLRSRHLLLRSGRHSQPQKAHPAVQSAGRIRQYDHSGRRDPRLPLRPRVAYGHGNHRLAGYGQDVGSVRSQGVRPPLSHPFP